MHGRSTPALSARKGSDYALGQSCARGERLAPGAFIGRSFHTVSAGGFTISRWVWNADHRAVEPHGHDDAHLMAVTSGRFVTTARGAPESAQTPLVYNPRETYHADRFEDGPSSFLSVSIDPERTEESQEFRLAREPVRICSLAARAIVIRLMNEMSLWCPDSPGVAEALCLELLAAVGNDRIAERRVPPWLTAAARLLEESPDDLTVNELAAEVRIHPIHLARTFRRFFRCTPGQYRRSVKLRRSISLLARMGIPIAEVAAEAGFADQAHLTRLFRKTYGIAPGAFRGLFA